MTVNWGKVLELCREQLGSPPREIDREQQRYMRVQLPLLMRLFLWLRGDKLSIILRDQRHLWTHGQVVWGHVVQANSLLFSPSNSQTLPANVLYSPDNYFDDRLPQLEDVAHQIFQLKGTSPEEGELKEFARAVTDELARTMRLPLPRSLSGGREVVFTTCFIEPAHLPSGYLCRGFFPLLICPERTDAVMILPARYWSKELRAAWINTD